MVATQVLKKIVITEKSYKLMERQQIVFFVDLRANKTEIKKAFETIFGYQVAGVNIMRRKAKKKRLGKYLGTTPRRKKAIITLSPGQKFEALEEASLSATSSSETPVKRTGFFGKFRDKIDSLTKINLSEKSEKKKEDK